MAPVLCLCNPAPDRTRPALRHRGCWLLLWGLWSAGLATADEFRGLWVDAFHAGFRSSTEVRQLIADARAGHFNALVVEVRKRGDAYYQSRFEPEATDIAAGYDPLADLITQAHSGLLPIEVHAWIVTYPIWKSETTSPTQADHPYLLHPDWLAKTDTGTTWEGNYNFDPGHPAVQEHTWNVAMDIVSRYDVDGLQLDYVRYPGREWGYNATSVARFNRRYGRSGQPAASDPTWMQWRRDQVTGLLRRIYLSVVALKPQVKVSAATITWTPSVATAAEWSSSAAYSSVLQDWRAWMQEGTLDLNVPMAYFRQAANGTDYLRWIRFAEDHRYARHVAIGPGTYLNSASNAIVQMRATRSTTAAGHCADGMVLYSYAVTCTNLDRAQFLQALVSPSANDTNPLPVYRDRTSPPAMSWKQAPSRGHILGRALHGVSGEALDPATLQLTGNSLTRTQATDGNGWFGFVDLPPGPYSLRASSSSLVPATAQLTVQTGVVARVDFNLFPSAGDLVLLNLRASAGAQSAVITWDTPAASSSNRVEFGLNGTLEHVLTVAADSGTRHVQLLTGLQANTDYSCRVFGTVDGTEYSSSLRPFRTAGDLVVDNPSAASVGSWSTGTASTDKYGADYAYAGVVSGVPTATATFAPTLRVPGFYDVYVWYPQGANRSAKAPFEVVGDLGTRAVPVNQTSGGGGWQLLAQRWHFAEGAEGLVRLANDTSESSRVVVADAVRWVYDLAQDRPVATDLPEWWARHFFGATSSGAADPDQDGATSHTEYVLGSDPSQAASRPELFLTPLAPDATACRLSFRPFLAGRLYGLLRSDTIDGPWVSVSEAVFAAMPDGAGLAVDPAPPDQAGFYRIAVALP